jgi:hypothetical protein
VVLPTPLETPATTRTRGTPNRIDPRRLALDGAG